jgi:hypothetical protein
MKLIEAMKKVKANRKKISDLQMKIAKNAARLSNETTEYRDQIDKQVAEWIDSCVDLGRECETLLVRIQKTNLQTLVAIELAPSLTIEKTIAEWVYRRREFAALDARTYSMLTDKGLKEGFVTNSLGEKTAITIIRHFDSKQRDKMVARYSEEPHLIDSRLEVVNAVTDLVD